MMLSSVLLMLLFAPALSLIDLFVAYAATSPSCYRQPVLVILNSSFVLAFAEGRDNGSYCSGAADGTNSSIWVRRSTDGGVSWSDSAMIYDAPPQPDYYSAVYDAQRSRVIVLIQTSPTMQIISDDAGVSWSKAGPAHVILPPKYSATPGVAHGIQIVPSLCIEPTCGGLTGRLIVAFVCHATATATTTTPNDKNLGDVSCKGCFSCLATSDDSGDTWTIATAAVSTQEGSREASIVQLNANIRAGSSGSKPIIYATERNMGITPGFRWHAISFDGANSFTSFGTDPMIPDGDTKNWTGIVAGATRVGNSVNIFTPNRTGARADLTRFTSVDEAVTWSPGVLFLQGPAGYSDAGELDADRGAGEHEKNKN